MLRLESASFDGVVPFTNIETKSVCYYDEAIEQDSLLNSTQLYKLSKKTSYIKYRIINGNPTILL